MLKYKENIQKNQALSQIRSEQRKKSEAFQGSRSVVPESSNRDRNATGLANLRIPHLEGSFRRAKSHEFRRPSHERDSPAT